mmetsp:Transcript_70553/g.204466  ORF Transcript_70553/g.204466 Transcript_70553/m.204466 type:complete len:365 (+) Transcript_70553:75-1169(+)
MDPLGGDSTYRPARSRAAAGRLSLRGVAGVRHVRGWRHGRGRRSGRRRWSVGRTVRGVVHRVALDGRGEMVIAALRGQGPIPSSLRRRSGILARHRQVGPPRRARRRQRIVRLGAERVADAAGEERAPLRAGHGVLSTDLRSPRAQRVSTARRRPHVGGRGLRSSICSGSRLFAGSRSSAGGVAIRLLALRHRRCGRQHDRRRFLRRCEQSILSEGAMGGSERLEVHPMQGGYGLQWRSLLALPARVLRCLPRHGQLDDVLAMPRRQVQLCSRIFSMRLLRGLCCGRRRRRPAQRLRCLAGLRGEALGFAGLRRWWGLGGPGGQLAARRRRRQGRHRQLARSEVPASLPQFRRVLGSRECVRGE